MSQVEIMVSIRENATGRTVVELDKCNANDDGAPSPFWWRDGNGACDCNRKIFFIRWTSDPEFDPTEDDCPCGDGAYSVNLATLDETMAPTTFYREFEE